MRVFSSLLNLAAMILVFGSPIAIAKEPKPVFAHYMVALPSAGPDATIEDYKEEIRRAQEAGIDGFALNCGGWTKQEPHYKERVVKMYKAAEELGSDFKLFISADFATKLTFDEFKDMVESFRHHPNQFRHDGKPVLSTFRGEQLALTKLVADEFTGDKAIVFVPFYYPTPPTELPTDQEIDQVFQENQAADGFFYFGAAGTPDQIAGLTKRMAQRWKTGGKIFMAPVSPYYLGHGVNNRVFESKGLQGMAEQWLAAIESDSDWIEITTWNDFSESSYVAPFGHPHKGNVWKGHWGEILDHSGFLGASRYYIDWFKTGQKPEILSDQVFYFYRLHPKTIAGKRGRPRNADQLQDQIYVTAFLKSPATLLIEVGDKKSTFDLSAGVNHVSSDIAIGTPRFTLLREGVEVASKDAEFPISAENAWSNFNYFSGSLNIQ
jgi:glucan endo-1,3-alpha-glucosidase